MEGNEVWADAVFEGGGVKGIGLVGALSVAEDHGYRWKKVAGTSAGAMIATLSAAGYTAKELYEILLQKDFSEFLIRTWYGRIPYLGPALSLLIKKGFYSGDALEKWVEKLLLQKGIATFDDFGEEVPVHLIASDITRGRLLVLPHDLTEYGYDPGAFSVARVVRMSCSIPYFFDPVKLLHKPSGKPCYIVDGAVLSNFPVWIFDRENPRWPTLGFRLFSPDEKAFHEIEGPFSMFISIFLTMMDAHDNRYIKEHDGVRTIQVPTLGIKLTDFSLSAEKKRELFQAGARAAESFFSTWDYRKHLADRAKKQGISYNLRPGDKAGNG
ncbi:patatin-like phospholipase family protein [Thermoactinomyces sp. CICC 10523]|uniref:patatin-like phospholipase family protein n=1 Tax=Thermoactinomyces sp. CICC 10523 TaxID=2767428 RepID=UPI0018DCFED4|nr:patatin-like phospholipase family protein [Thermoactinomyces sp. CICC 10523]MBH8596773.1 patatin-like phospholipase family protein [Thermoactinomyces sp. CICC 10523]